MWARIGKGHRAIRLAKFLLMNRLQMISLLTAAGLAGFRRSYCSVDFFDRI